MLSAQDDIYDILSATVTAAMLEVYNVTAV